MIGNAVVALSTALLSLFVARADTIGASVVFKSKLLANRKMPTYILPLGYGEFLVSESIGPEDGGKVSVINDEGDFVRSLRDYSQSLDIDGEHIDATDDRTLDLHTPMGLGIVRNNVYVACIELGLVKVHGGRIVATAGGPSDPWEAQLEAPRSVVAGNGFVFVSDANKYTVTAYDHDTLERHFVITSKNLDTNLTGDVECIERNPIQGEYQGASCFNPTGLAIGAKRLYVVDTENNRMLMFSNADGTHVGTIEGMLSPRDIALTRYGRLLVAEESRVALYSFKGETIGVAEVPESLECSGLHGLATSGNQVFATDPGSGHVFEFELEEPEDDKDEDDEDDEDEVVKSDGEGSKANHTSGVVHAGNSEGMSEAAMAQTFKIFMDYSNVNESDYPAISAEMREAVEKRNAEFEAEQMVRAEKETGDYMVRIKKQFDLETKNRDRDLKKQRARVLVKKEQLAKLTETLIPYPMARRVLLHIVKQILVHKNNPKFKVIKKRNKFYREKLATVPNQLVENFFKLCGFEYDEESRRIALHGLHTFDVLVLEAAQQILEIVAKENPDPVLGKLRTKEEILKEERDEDLAKERKKTGVDEPKPVSKRPTETVEIDHDEL